MDLSLEQFKNKEEISSSRPVVGPGSVGVALGMIAGIDMIAGMMIPIAGAHIQGGIGASPEEYLWVLTAYAAAATLMNVVLGKVADRIGYRGYLFGSLLVFMVGSVLCGVSQSVPGLVLARGVQGIGGGGLFAAARILVQIGYAPKDRARVMNGFGLGANGLVTVAPWLTAWLVDLTDWRSVFLLQAAIVPPVLIYAFVVLPSHLHRPSATEEGELDWHSMLALTLGVFLLLHALGDLRYTRIEESLRLALMLGGGVLALVYTGIRFHNHPDPWMDPHRLRNRIYLAGLGFYVVFYLLNGVWNYLLPVLLQGGLGFDFRTTGRLMTWNGLVALLTILLFPLFVRRWWRMRRVVAVGYVLLALSSWLVAARAMPGISEEALLPVILLQGMVMVPALLQTATMTFVELPVEDFAHAYQLKNTLRQIATAVSTGVTTLLLQDGNAAFRTRLVENVSVYNPNLGEVGQLTQQHLAMLSAEIDRQATLLTCQYLFIGLAVVSLIAAALVSVQRWMK